MPGSGNRPGGMTESVAIVGMSVLLPGADTLDGYWSNLVNGVDSITDVPPNRWGPELYDPERGQQPERLYCRRGGFVDELAYFDPMAFGVMPASVPEIEPEQLLALRVAAAAIEDAGGMGRLPDHDRVGVILGRLGISSITNVKFYLRVRLADQMCYFLRDLVPELAEDRLARIRELIGERLGPYHPEAVIGLMPNLTAARVANRLDLRGPSYILDAACASSLIAVDHGIAELLSGRLDMVLAGGVHHNHDVTFWAVFNQLRALSRRGEIRPFDTAADGLLIGEGTGVVVLKRLSDAVRDGDRIHAVIRGSGASGDGRSASLVNPETAGQALAVRRAWAAAGLDPAAPDALGLLEAHGTGTPVGDAAELATVAQVFGPQRGDCAPVIGSVKSMIGHSMAAAGVAALVKAVLAVSRGVLPPTLHCDNPRAEMAGTRFRPIAAARPWDGPGLRRAGVNAFGFGGINAHVVIEQAPDTARPRRRSHERAAPASAARVYEPDQIVLLAAPDGAALARLLAADDDAVRAHGTSRAANGTARAANGAGSPSGDRCRIGIADPTGERLSAARKVVAAGAPWRDGRDIWFSPQPLLADGQGQIAFVFPGLEAELSHRVDDVAAHFGLGAEVAEFGGQETDEFSGRSIEVMRVGWLLHQALERIGVMPDVVAGHSLGDWTARLVAGLVDESRLAELSGIMFNPAVERHDLLHAVIGDSADAVEGRLAGYPGVFLSHDNAPRQSVVCGPAEQVTRLIQDLGGQGIICRPLPFATGVHTPYMEASVQQLRAGAEQESVAERPARVPVWSALLAAPLPAGTRQHLDVLFRQLVEPVRFRPTVTAMHDAGIRAFVQVGPGQLGSLIHESLRGRDHLVIAAHVDFRSGLAQLQRVATALWVEGYAPDLSALGPAEKVRSASAAASHSMRMRLELGTEQISLGEAARGLLGSPALAPAEAATGTGAPAAATALATVNHPGVGAAATAELAALLKETADAGAAVVAAAAATGQRAASSSPGRPPEARPVEGGDAACKSVLRVSLETMPYLMDHSFNLQPAGWPDKSDFMPVVPATTIVQHMIDAVEAAKPGRVAIRVIDARFTRWAIAEPAQDVEITVNCTAPDQFTVSFGPFARARIETAAAYPAEAPPAWRQDPAAERPSPLSAERMYATRVMFHGPRYRGVEVVHAVGERGVRGQLRALAPPGALLDGALQLTGNWASVILPTRNVLFPNGFGSIQFFGPPPSEGALIDCVGGVNEIDQRTVTGDIQFCSGSRVWAVMSGCQSRRFDSHPRARALERLPGGSAVALRQPEGWVVTFDYWPDPAAQNFFARATLGATEYAQYEQEKVATRTGWLLDRLSVKDAIRYLLWDDDHGKEIFPVEISVSEAEDGRPHVQGWAGLALPAYVISSARASHVGVAMARPASPGATASAPGVGIGVAEITDSPPGGPLIPLSDRELDVLEAVSGTDPGSPRALWSARFRAAKEAAAKAAGIGRVAAPRLVTVTDATPAVITVAACGRTHQLGHREIRAPEELATRHYVVAWTWGWNPR